MALLAVAVALASPQSVALAQDGPVAEVRVDPPLARQGAPSDLVVSGRLGGPWPAAVVRVDIFGPGDPSSDPTSLPLAGSVSREAGDLSGEFELEIPLRDVGGLERPGGYRATVTVASGPDKSMEASGYFGLAPAGGDPIEVVFVWPIAYGIHQDPDGVFVDGVLESAVVPRPEATNSLYAFFQSVDRYPNWRMSWAVEPVLLTQLRDMADGYLSSASGGEPVEVGDSEQPAQLAGRALDAFRAVTGQESIHIVATPYAMPSLPLLAAEGWEDGLSQMQLGKSLLQEILDLPETLDSGYPPGADLTTESLRYLAGASLDHAVAAPAVAADLVEEPDEEDRPVRVRDPQNNRVTLSFASQGLRAALAAPWRADRFFAALAAESAAGRVGPFIAVPATDYGIPPLDFLQDLGAGLSRAAFVRTLTLADVLERYPPPTRPIFLTRYGGLAEGFVGQAYQERLKTTHALVEDFELATDSDRAPLNDIRLLLYQGESRYWFADGADPEVANLGLSYLDRARGRVQEEFDKIDVAGDKSVIMMGSGGEVPVAVVNQAGYEVRGRLVLEARGLEVNGELERPVILGPQENIIQVPVDVGGGSAELTVRVLVGQTEVDTETISVRSLALGTLLPWLVVGLVLVAAGVAAVLRFR